MGDSNPQVSFAKDIKTPVPCERSTLVHMQCAVTDLLSWSKGRARSELISHGNLNKSDQVYHKSVTKWRKFVL